ncbi:hypothetical protein E4T42_08613 [Aureobasidium subglaciale]|nr:hypothetical protein E4T42_08613 [Aureobasidium subglaciale]
MATNATISGGLKPHDITACSYDIQIKMLQDEVLKLKKKSTDTSLKEIDDKEKEIGDKRIALEKHCRQFGIKYGKYGTEESEIKLESTNDEHTESMVDPNAKTEHDPFVDVKMDLDSKVHAVTHTDTVAGASPEHAGPPRFASMGAQLDGTHAFQQSSMPDDMMSDLGDFPGHIPGSHEPFFVPSVPDYQNVPASGGFVYDYGDNDPFVNQNVDYAATAAGAGAHPVARSSLYAFTNDASKMENSNMANYVTSVGDAGGSSMETGREEEMDDTDFEPETLVAEFAQPIIPGMEKYENLS